MIMWLFTLITISVTFAQSSSQIDPNKFTICTITINSDEERKIFESQVKKYPDKFNSLVELTNFGDDKNWFTKACQSGVRCDQLIISGHFAGTFFGESSEKELSLEDLEKAGCSKSCEGILGNPYEVFLFGCNTLAEKKQDGRTPEQYLQVLLQDGRPLAEAEATVQSRYGALGDSNRVGMQRAFSGEKKQLYGFDSIGPSGKTIKSFLNNYFSKISPAEHLEKLQAKRMLDKVDMANAQLAASLKPTAFTQCETGELTDPVMKKVCSIQDSRMSVDQRLGIVTELIGSEYSFSSLPAINAFFKAHPPEEFNEKQKQEFSFIASNDAFKKQILGLIEKSKSVGHIAEWAQFAETLGYMSPENASAQVKNSALKAISNKPKREDVDIICSLDKKVVSKVSIQYSDIKSINLGANEIDALNCLDVKDSVVYTNMTDLFSKTNVPTVQKSLVEFMRDQMAEGVVLSDKVENKIRLLMKSPNKDLKFSSLKLLGKMKPKDEAYNKDLVAYLKIADPADKLDAVTILRNDGVHHPAMVAYLASLAKSTPYSDIFEQSAYALMNVTTGQDMRPVWQGLMEDPKVSYALRMKLYGMINEK